MREFNRFDILAAALREEYISLNTPFQISEAAVLRENKVIKKKEMENNWQVRMQDMRSKSLFALTKKGKWVADKISGHLEIFCFGYSHVSSREKKYLRCKIPSMFENKPFSKL